MHDFAYAFYAKMKDVFVTLMPGMLVMSHLYELPSAEHLVTGIADFAKATAARPVKGRTHRRN